MLSAKIKRVSAFLNKQKRKNEEYGELLHYIKGNDAFKMDIKELNSINNLDTLNNLLLDAELVLTARFGAEYALKPELVVNMAGIIQKFAKEEKKQAPCFYEADE